VKQNQRRPSSWPLSPVNANGSSLEGLLSDHCHSSTFRSDRTFRAYGQPRFDALSTSSLRLLLSCSFVAGGTSGLSTASTVADIAL
jgi:hypothetical protein